MTLDELLKLDPRTLRTQNRNRLQNLGLPGELLSAGFWEREQEARERELLLLALFEAVWQSGAWAHLDLPFAQIVAAWKQRLQSPFYFSSVDERPRWMNSMQNMLGECRKVRTGQRGRWKVLNQRKHAQAQHEAGLKRKQRATRPSKYV